MSRITGHLVVVDPDMLKTLREYPLHQLEASVTVGDPPITLPVTGVHWESQDEAHLTLGDEGVNWGPYYEEAGRPRSEVRVAGYQPNAWKVESVQGAAVVPARRLNL